MAELHDIRDAIWDAADKAGVTPTYADTIIKHYLPNGRFKSMFPKGDNMAAMNRSTAFTELARVLELASRRRIAVHRTARRPPPAA